MPQNFINVCCKPANQTGWLAFPGVRLSSFAVRSLQGCFWGACLRFSPPLLVFLKPYTIRCSSQIICCLGFFFFFKSSYTPGAKTTLPYAASKGLLFLVSQELKAGLYWTAHCLNAEPMSSFKNITQAVHLLQPVSKSCATASSFKELTKRRRWQAGTVTNSPRGLRRNVSSRGGLLVSGSWCLPPPSLAKPLTKAPSVTCITYCLPLAYPARPLNQSGSVLKGTDVTSRAVHSQDTAEEQHQVQSLGSMSALTRCHQHVQSALAVTGKPWTG